MVMSFVSELNYKPYKEDTDKDGNPILVFRMNHTGFAYAVRRKDNPLVIEVRTYLDETNMSPSKLKRYEELAQRIEADGFEDDTAWLGFIHAAQAGESLGLLTSYIIMTDFDELKQTKAQCLRDITEALPDYVNRLNSIDTRLLTYIDDAISGNASHANLMELLGHPQGNATDGLLRPRPRTGEAVAAGHRGTMARRATREGRSAVLHSEARSTSG